VNDYTVKLLYHIRDDVRIPYGWRWWPGISWKHKTMVDGPCHGDFDEEDHALNDERRYVALMLLGLRFIQSTHPWVVAPP